MTHVEINYINKNGHHVHMMAITISYKNLFKF